jgi:hypothetical protein
MSWAETLDKLSITVKNIAVSLCILIPFWFMAIYLFHKPLYNSGDYLIIAVFCFCFSITWYFLGAMIALAIANRFKADDEFQVASLVGGIISILYIALTILLTYVFNWSFFVFIGIAYGYFIINLILSLTRAPELIIEQIMTIIEKNESSNSNPNHPA